MRHMSERSEYRDFRLGITITHLFIHGPAIVVNDRQCHRKLVGFPLARGHWFDR